jgi:hypothetical protein
MRPNYHPSLTDGTFDRPRAPAPRSLHSAPQHDSDEGEQLGKLSRKNGDEELRIARRSFNGFEYIDLRVWFRGEDGQYRPTKTGVTVKLHEIDHVVAALSKAKGAHR